MRYVRDYPDDLSSALNDLQREGQRKARRNQALISPRLIKVRAIKLSDSIHRLINRCVPALAGARYSIFETREIAACFPERCYALRTCL